MVARTLLKALCLSAYLLYHASAAPAKVTELAEIRDWIRDNEHVANSTAATPRKWLAIWTTSVIATVPGGSADPGHDFAQEGFTLINSNGKTIWAAATPDDHSICGDWPSCRTFTLKGACMAGNDYKFRCVSPPHNIEGDPGYCGVLNIASQTLGTGHVHTQTDFYGIVLNIKNVCAVAFPIPDNVYCGPNTPVATIPSESYYFDNGYCGLT